ncbi:MAG TPA: TIGR03435 family protein [Vicinamibacterales bacterium]|nr:TIGR03435 family protein [Vicinamibacterales bacterium]
MRCCKRWNSVVLVAALLGVVCVSSTSHAQRSAVQTASAFEVASVKVGVPDDVPTGIRPVSAGGQFRAVLTVHDLVQVAYGAPLALLPSQVIGGPDWVATERFEIVAKANGLANAPSGGRDELLAMMRTLLAGRFRLQIRKESRELAIFNLVLDRPDRRLGPRLHPADGQCVATSATTGAAVDPSNWCGFRRFTPSAISARGMTLDAFASGISTRADIQRVVRDRAGLAGNFDLDVDYTPDAVAPGESQSASAERIGLSTAMKEQLGLRLESAKGPVDVFIIDYVERPMPD